MIRTRCPRCQKLLGVTKLDPSGVVACPLCKHKFRIQQKKPAVEEDPVEVVEEVDEVEVVDEDVEELEAEESVEVVDDDVVELEEAIEDDRPRKPKKRKKKRAPPRGILEAIPLSYQAQTNIGVGLGFLLQIVGGVLFSPLSPPWLLVVPAAAVFFVWGCCAYAKMKGHPALFGLFGLIGCIGLIILVLLPYRSSEDT